MVSPPLLCRTTDDLPCELAVAREVSASDVNGKLSRPLFPGVLLTCSGQLCAAMGFDVEPGRTLAITAPVFLRRDAPEVLAEWGRQLLQEVLLEATRRDCRTARFVHPIATGADSELFISLLREAGFSVRAGIVKWSKVMALSTGSGCSSTVESSTSGTIVCDFLSCESLRINLIQRQLLLNLLRDVLSGTQDLLNLPSPDAEELLNDWIDQRATIVVGRRGGREIALCVGVREWDSADSSMALIRIQYIGVSPEHRRSGVATAMLRSVPQLVAAAGKTAAVRQLQLTAFADASNQAAAQWYRTCGFHVDSKYDLWCRGTSGS